MSSDKTAFNALLKDFRQLQAQLDDVSKPLDQREALLPSFQAMIHRLSALLNAIGTYTSQEVSEGFAL